MFGLFSGDDGCGGHHFGDWRSAYGGNYTIELAQLKDYTEMAEGGGNASWRTKFVVYEKQFAVCQHDGCDEKKHRKKPIRYIDRRGLDDIGEPVTEHIDVYEDER